MESIHIESNTEYFAKKYSIDRATQYFQENKERYFVIVRLSWDDGVLKGEESIVIRREVISQFYGVDFVKSQDRKIHWLSPVNREEYMELFSALKFHQPQGADVEKAVEINEKIFSKQGNVRRFSNK